MLTAGTAAVPSCIGIDQQKGSLATNQYREKFEQAETLDCNCRDRLNVSCSVV
jgi:hypothetical protein